MKRFNVLLGILLIACMAISAATSGAPRILAENTPDPATLLQQSIAAMKGSLHTAHAAGRSAIASNGQKAAFTVTGTCALSGTRLDVKLHLKGTTIGEKSPVSLNEEDGLIWSQSPGWVAVFTRPAGADKTWQSIDPFDSTGAQMFSSGCPLIMSRQLEQQPLTNLTLVGPQTVGTETTWHLRSTVTSAGSTQRIDLYIGQQSQFLLRIDSTASTEQSKQSVTMDYSAFNHPVTIALPSVQALPGRAMHSAVRLSDGRVLVLSGAGNASAKTIVMNGWADLYDPATGTWSRMTGLPSVPILPSVAVSQGHVLLTAYFYPAGAVMQLFDPATTTWKPMSGMRVSRVSQVAVVLKDGRLLVAGGYNMQAGWAETSAEIYDPEAGTWSRTGNLNQAHVMGAVTALLPNGRLLVMGGTLDGAPSAEIYHPVKGTWTMAHVPAQSRVVALWTLSSGKVLAIASSPGRPLATTTYDPVKDTWTGTHGSPVTTDNYASVLLKNGKLLVAGGVQTPGAGPLKVLSTAWLFDPKTGRWSTTGSMKQARAMHSMTLLANGTVLVAGGFGSISEHGPYNALSSAELYDPATGKWTWTGSMK